MYDRLAYGTIYCIRSICFNFLHNLDNTLINHHIHCLVVPHFIINYRKKMYFKNDTTVGRCSGLGDVF